MLKKFSAVCLSLTFILTACGKEVASVSAASSKQTGANQAVLVKKSASESDDTPVKLTISTYFLNDEVKSAIKEYKKLHPNVDIQLQAGQSSGKDFNDMMLNQEKYIKTTSTSLLAGKGPDLVELDLFPVDKYVSRGVIVNLNDMMTQDSSFKTANYFTNILDKVKKNGGLYSVPLYFKLYSLYGDEKAISATGVKFDDKTWSMDQFIDVIKQLKKKGTRKYGYIYEPKLLLQMLAQQNYSTLITHNNGNAKFDATAFAKLLQYTKSLFDQNILGDSSKIRLSSSGGKGKVNLKGISPDSYFYQGVINKIEDYFRDTASNNVKFYNNPLLNSNHSGGSFGVSGSLGISANSAHKQQAWNFLKFLMDYNYTNPDAIISGIPISKVNYNQNLQQLKTAGGQSGSAGTKLKIDNKAISSLNAIIEGAGNLVGDQPDSKIDTIIYQESDAFYSGQKSADAVAKIIQNKIELFLNE